MEEDINKKEFIDLGGHHIFWIFIKLQTEKISFQYFLCFFLFMNPRDRAGRCNVVFHLFEAEYFYYYSKYDDDYD